MSVRSSSGSRPSSRSSCSSPSPTLHQQKGLVVTITGGSGALGSNIAKHIYSHWDDVQEIRLFDCAPPDSTLVTSITGYASSREKAKVSYYPGNILDSDALSGAFVKTDAVIHCASVVENGSLLNRKRMKRVNVDGTQKVIQACLECGVCALIFTGSLSQDMSYSNKRQVVRYKETTASTPIQHKEDLLYPYYGGSKNEAENLVLLANGQEGKSGTKLYTCSLRLPVMFGEGDTMFVPTGLRIAKCCFGYLVPMGLLSTTGTTMQSLYIGNAAWAHVVAAQKLLDVDRQEEICGKYYYIGDHSPICSLVNFHDQFLNPMGFRVLPIGIPLVLMMCLAYVVEFILLIASYFNVDLAIPLNRGTVRFARLSHSYSWEKARKELQYEPLYSNKTALARSMEYYRKIV